MELDGPFLTVFLPDMEIWAVVTINIEEMRWKVAG